MTDLTPEPNYFAGIDYSITSPGLCVYPNVSFWDPEGCQFYIKSKYGNLVRPAANGIMFDLEYSVHDAQSEPSQRYEEMASWALSKLPANTEIAIEDYSYGAKGRVFHIAENTGILKYLLWKRGLEHQVVPPTTIKKFATGKGNAKKHEIVEQFEYETGLNITDILDIKRKSARETSPVTDIADSYFIAKYMWSEYYKL